MIAIYRPLSLPFHIEILQNGKFKSMTHRSTLNERLRARGGIGTTRPQTKNTASITKTTSAKAVGLYVLPRPQVGHKYDHLRQSDLYDRSNGETHSLALRHTRLARVGLRKRESRTEPSRNNSNGPNNAVWEGTAEQGKIENIFDISSVTG